MLSLLALTASFASKPSYMPGLQLARSAVIRCSEQDAYLTDSLVSAARKGSIDALREALGRRDVDVNRPVSSAKIVTMDGASALAWAARQGQLEAVSLLLEAEANVNAETLCGWTPLYVAALNGHVEIVEMLVARGASVSTALSLGDERTNINLRRMIGSMAQSEVAPPVSLTPTPQPPPAVSPLPPLAAVPALGGMSELETLRLRMDWKAPPTAEEQRAAEAARQTLFKYRYDKVRQLEAEELTSGRGRGVANGPTAVPPASAVVTPASAPPAPASMGMGASDDVLSRLAAVEAALAGLSGTKQTDPSGYADGYADGFASGFAAGRASA